MKPNASCCAAQVAGKLHRTTQVHRDCLFRLCSLPCFHLCWPICPSCMPHCVVSPLASPLPNLDIVPAKPKQLLCQRMPERHRQPYTESECVACAIKRMRCLCSPHKRLEHVHQGGPLHTVSPAPDECVATTSLNAPSCNSSCVSAVPTPVALRRGCMQRVSSREQTLGPAQQARH